MRLGIIADTHGYFDARVAAHFTGVDQIIHAGDIGSADVVARLEALAPVTAVTGNVDWGGPLDRLHPRVAHMEIGGRRIYVTHIGGRPAELVRRLPEPRPDVFIYGHSHIPVMQEIEGVLFLNPGAAGKPRFGRRPSVALLDLVDGRPSARVIML